MSHGVDQAADVRGHIRPVVASCQHPDDVLERALSVAQLEHLRRARIESYGTLGDEQQVLLAHFVVAQPRAGDEAGTFMRSPARARSILRVSALDGVELRPQHLGLEPERRDGGFLVLARPAALHREVERVCASRGAFTSRVRKYSSPAGSIHG